MSTEGQPGHDATRPAGIDATRIAGSVPEAPREGDVPGQLGPYRILKRVGGGGMGHIYLAEQTSLRRQVALKVLPPGFLEGSEAHERFQREVQVLGQLSHPNICPVLEAGRDGDTFYYAMEYLRGLDLAKVLKTQRMEPRRAAEIAVQVLRALQFAHDKGVVHRDLKPHNIMLVRGEKSRAGSMAVASTKLSLVQRIFGAAPPKAAPAAPAADSVVADPHLPSPEWQDHAVLIDFGLARDATQRSTKLTITGAVVGTPAYMSPEQARGDQKTIGARSDVYSMGAVLYEALALRPPFEGDTVAQIIHNVIETDARPLRAVNPLLDRDLETVVARAMEKDPARRYPTAGEFADDLERWLAGEPILARPASLWYRWRKRVARNRLATAAIALAMSLVGLGLWFAFAPGTLAIESTPAGAEVWVEGKRVGVTPYAGRWIPGQRTLELRLADYETEKDFPVVESGGETRVVRTLRHETGRLTLTSEPSEVGLELTRADGRVLKVAAPAADQLIETGTWRVRATARNHFPREFTLEVRPGQRHRRHVTLNALTIWSQWAGGPNQTALARDLNGDGRPDLVGAWFEPFRVQAMDGVDGTLLWKREIEPLLPGGNVRVDAGDLDGDLEEEVVFVDGAERVVVLEGATGRLRAERGFPGARMCWIHDDVDGDRLRDVAVLAPGVFRVVSGESLADVWTAGLEGRIGWACEARCRAEGPRDVVVWAMGFGVVALDGRTGAPVWRSEIVPGGAFCAADVDADGLDDVVGVTAGRELYALSGADGRVLYRQFNPEFDPTQECTIANLDADAAPEIARNAGDRILVLDGRTGAVEATLRIQPSHGQSAVADVDHDGAPDLVVPSIDSLVAADPRTGRILWQFKADSPIFRHPVLADFNADGRLDVAACSWLGTVYVLAAEDLPVVWKQEAGGWISSGLMPLGDPAVAVYSEGNRLDPRDGGELARSVFSWTGYGGLLRIDGRDLLLVHVGGEHVQMDALTLKEVRRGPAAGLSPPTLIDLDGDGTPEILSGDTWDGQKSLQATDARTGQLIWRVEHHRPNRAGMAFLNGLLWAPDAEGFVALDPRTGVRRGAIPVPGPLCSVREFRGRLLFATTRGRVALVAPPPDGGSAAVTWEVETGLPFTHESPVAAGGLVVAFSSTGTAIALDANDGRRIWKHDFSAAVESAFTLRDLDGDGAPEVAVALKHGLVAVLDGRTGRIRWRARPGGEIGPITPTWADLDGDARPELLVTTQRPHGYALRVTLDEPVPAYWPSYRTRAESYAHEAARELALRERVLEGERSGNDAWVMEAARESPSPYSCTRGAFAAERLGDAAGARDLATRAVALGARRLDLDWLLARLSDPAAAEPAFAAALARARPERIADCIPAAADRPLWNRAALAAARERAGAGDSERAVVLFDAAGEFAAGDGFFERARATGADPGPLHLSRARAAVRDDRFDAAFTALREAVRSGPSRTDAEDLLARLDREGRFARADAIELRDAGRIRDAVPLFTRAARLLPDSAGAHRDLAAVLTDAPDATPDEKRLALDHARIALRLLETRSPADRVSRAIVLDTLATAQFANGDAAGAVKTLKEALSFPVSAQNRPGMEARLAVYEAASR